MRSFLLLAVLMAVTHAAPVVRSTTSVEDGDGLAGLDLGAIPAPAHHKEDWAQKVADNAQPATNNAKSIGHGQVSGQNDGAHYLVGTRRR